MMTFMNLASSTLPYLGSGRISRLGTSRRRGISSPLQLLQRGGPFRAPGGPWGLPLTRPTGGIACFGSLRSFSLPGLMEHRQTLWARSGLLRALRAVLRTGLLAILHALQVQ